MRGDALGKVRAASLLSLFTSGSTLICCALPALLVALGAGAALSSLVTAVPQLVWFSEQKEMVLGAAGVMLAGAALLHWRARRLPCPLDPALAAACAQTRSMSQRVLLVSLGIYLVGAYFAFLAG
jgi:hypothetical protein